MTETAFGLADTRPAAGLKPPPRNFRPLDEVVWKVDGVDLAKPAVIARWEDYHYRIGRAKDGGRMICDHVLQDDLSGISMKSVPLHEIPQAVRDEFKRSLSAKPNQQ